MFTTKPQSHLIKVSIVAIIFAGIGLSSCNTIEGAGQDIKSTGKAIEKTADDNK